MSTQTLSQAQEWLRTRLDDGERCPCCTQFVKIYRRKIHRTMAKALIAIYRAALAQGGPHEYVHLSSTAGSACEGGKLRYWGLLEESPTSRGDGGSAGFWRLTPLGEAFVLGRTTVPKYARIFDGRCLGLTGDPVGIRDCLPVGFDLTDLMAGR